MVEVKVDTRAFDAAFSKYADETSKTLVDAVNFKLYDCSRAAIKGTKKADKGSIRESLSVASKLYPNRTVAEMIYITRCHNNGEPIGDIKAEVEELKKKRTSHTGFIKAGWIPALRKLLKYVSRDSVTIGGLAKMAFGGADPALKTGSKVVGSVYNDTTGKGGNQGFVSSIKEIGAQAGIDKVTLDMNTYLAKKLGVPIDKFNHS